MGGDGWGRSGIGRGSEVSASAGSAGRTTDRREMKGQMMFYRTDQLPRFNPEPDTKIPLCELVEVARDEMNLLPRFC